MNMAGHSHGSSSAGNASMSTVFHFGNTEFILFPGFTPMNDAEFVGAVLFAFSISFISFAIGAFKRMRLAYKKVHPSPFARAERAALETIHQVFRFLMMLLIMTFNVWIFVAVLLGIFMGTFIWDPEMVYHFKNESERKQSSTSEDSNAPTLDSPFLPKAKPLTFE